mmetsp:Transcript_22163/g.41861  ORF Transcript_22163/g.41861 Transcript_22163/m.41861 type:complete len:200 (+) Transcript_22163:5138-5737(+)
MSDTADWSGYSPPVSNKKHITAIYVGVAPKDEAVWKPGRRGVSNEKSSNASSTSILGGPVPEKDPSVVSSSNWQTEAQAASSQAKTSREQLTESGRSMFVRGKQSTVPAYEKACPFSESVGAQLRDENPYCLNDQGSIPADSKDKSNEENGNPNTIPSDSALPGYSLVGYRSGGGVRSFLEGLGTEVAASMMSSSSAEE